MTAIGTVLWNTRASKHPSSSDQNRVVELKNALLRQSLYANQSRVWLLADGPGLVATPPADRPSFSHGYYSNPAARLSGFWTLNTDDIEVAKKVVTNSPQLKFGGDLEIRFLEGVSGRRLGLIILGWNDPEFHTDAGHGLDISAVIELYNNWAKDMNKTGILIDAHKLDFDGSEFIVDGETVDGIYRGAPDQLVGILTAEDDPGAVAELVTRESSISNSGTVEKRLLSLLCKKR